MIMHALNEWSTLDMNLASTLRDLGQTDPASVIWAPMAWLLTWMADFKALPVYLVVLWGWSVLARRRDSTPAGRIATTVVQLGCAGLLAIALVLALKSGMAFMQSAFLGGQQSATPEFDSFPSGHATLAALLAATLWRLASTEARMVLIAFALSAGAARVVLGWHDTADVLAGWLLGVTCAAIGRYMARVRAADSVAGNCLLFAMAVFVADLLTKLAAGHALSHGETVRITSFFNVVHWQNQGAAFGFLSNASGWQRPFLIAVALAATVWLVRAIRAEDAPSAERVAYAAILAGALGNVVDRLIRGAVVDWLDVHIAGYHWPAFNLADIGITLGAAALVVFSVARPRPIAQDGHPS